MDKIEITFREVWKELLEMFHDKCESMSDIQCQEEKLDRINDTIKQLEVELQQRRKEMETRSKEIQQRIYVQKIVRCFPNKLPN